MKCLFIYTWIYALFLQQNRSKHSNCFLYSDFFLFTIAWAKKSKNHICFRKNHNMNGWWFIFHLKIWECCYCYLITVICVAHFNEREWRRKCIKTRTINAITLQIQWNRTLTTILHKIHCALQQRPIEWMNGACSLFLSLFFFQSRKIKFIHKWHWARASHCDATALSLHNRHIHTQFESINFIKRDWSNGQRSHFQATQSH